jgi:hypothetical protein
MGGVTVPQLTGAAARGQGTLGCYGVLRGGPAGVQGQKCSLLDQKGGNEHQKSKKTDGKRRNRPNFDENGQIGTKSKEIEGIPQFKKAKKWTQTDGQTIHRSELGYLVPRPTRILPYGNPVSTALL